MSSKFTHYLITRFNVPVKNWERDKEGRPVLDESWMKDRLELFTTFCIPTIESQVSNDFHWLIYCDELTLPNHLDSIRESIAQVPQAGLHLVKDFQHLLSELKNLLATADTPYVISSRVDNDDGLGIIYIQKTQDFFVPEDKILINLTGGILYDRDKQVLTELQNMRLNHYGSLIEKTSKEGHYLTIMGYPHHQPPENIKIQNIPSRYAWLKIIHKRNLNSTTFGVPVFFNKNISLQYGLDSNTLHISAIHSILYFFNRSIIVMKHKVLRLLL